MAVLSPLSSIDYDIERMNDMNDAPPPSYGANDDGPPPPKYEDVHDTNGEYSYYFLQV